jgi:hypothetical protein
MPSKNPRARPGPRARPRLNPAGTLLLSALVFAVSAGLTLSGGNAIFCERLAPLGVAAAVAAFLIALGFRLLSRTAPVAPDHARGILGCALLLAAVALFVDVRFIAHYRGPCSAMEQQLRDLKHAR